jgi:hypothetical protein
MGGTSAPQTSLPAPTNKIGWIAAQSREDWAADRCVPPREGSTPRPLTVVLFQAQHPPSGRASTLEATSRSTEPKEERAAAINGAGPPSFPDGPRTSGGSHAKALSRLLSSASSRFAGSVNTFTNAADEVRPGVSAQRSAAIFFKRA